MARRALLLFLCLGALAAALLPPALAQVVREGNLVVTIEGDIAPKALPKREPAPISLRVSGSLRTADGAHPPVIKTIFLQFDRHGALNTKGLPACRAAQLQSTTTAVAMRTCKDALIGAGRAEAEVALPEQAPFSASGPMLIFNGPPKGSKRTLLIHVYAFVPAPTTFVTSALIGHEKGKYATTAEVKVPSIVAGQGSLTAFEAKLERAFTYKGKKESVLLASCPTGHLYAHGDFTFADGAELSGSVAKSCTPKG
jgi:hypothetical protein